MRNSRKNSQFLAKVLFMLVNFKIFVCKFINIKLLKSKYKRKLKYEQTD